jgi:serine-type D-Ala-D-Ala carboxypeptidase (penicillin-binding protein 5/6)
LVVALLGAENRPARGWEQGAVLLDWGFALPADASVGRLIAPDEARRASPRPTQRADAGQPAQVSRLVTHLSVLALTLVVLSVGVGGPLLGAVVVRRRRGERVFRRQG